MVPGSHLHYCAVLSEVTLHSNDSRSIYLSVVVGGGEVERRSHLDLQQVPGRVEEERKSGPR